MSSEAFAVLEERYNTNGDVRAGSFKTILERQFVSYHPLDLVKESAKLGDSFALGWLAGRTSGEEGFEYAAAAAKQVGSMRN